MALTIANWTISVRFQRANTNSAARASDTTNDELRRRQINHDIAREREQAHTRWMLLGGNVNR
jgi:hypothetical protein